MVAGIHGVVKKVIIKFSDCSNEKVRIRTRMGKSRGMKWFAEDDEFVKAVEICGKPGTVWPIREPMGKAAAELPHSK